MKFVFRGNGNSDPQSIDVFGLRFELNGEPVDVLDPRLKTKLSNNRHFECISSQSLPIASTMVEQDNTTSEAPSHETDTTLDENGIAWNAEQHIYPPRKNAKGLWAKRPGRKSA